jgi:hypothetical protein
MYLEATLANRLKKVFSKVSMLMVARGGIES